LFWVNIVLKILIIFPIPPDLKRYCIFYDESGSQSGFLKNLDFCEYIYPYRIFGAVFGVPGHIEQGREFTYEKTGFLGADPGCHCLVDKITAWETGHDVFFGIPLKGKRGQSYINNNYINLGGENNEHRWLDIEFRF
jgi:hypothetical protein